MIRCVVFDFDGTLVDSNGLKRGGFFELASRDPRGPDLMKEALENVLGDRRAILLDYVERMGTAGVRFDLDELVSAYAGIVDPRVVAAPEMPGATRLLRDLGALGISRYVSSGTPADSLSAIISGRGWAGYFEGIFGQPAAKEMTLLHLIDAERLTPEQLLVVGDGEDDARAAEVAGCAFLPVGSGSYASRHPGASTFSLDEVKRRVSEHGRASP